MSKSAGQDVLHANMYPDPEDVLTARNLVTASKPAETLKHVYSAVKGTQMNLNIHIPVMPKPGAVTVVDLTLRHLETALDTKLRQIS